MSSITLNDYHFPTNASATLKYAPVVYSKKYSPTGNILQSFISKSTSIAPTLARLSGPAYLASLVGEYGVNWALDTYNKDLGLGKYSKDNLSSNGTPSGFAPIPEPIPPKPEPLAPDVTPVYEGETLLSVLQGGNIASSEIARQFSNSNQIAFANNEALNNLVSLVQAQIDINSIFAQENLDKFDSMASSFDNLALTLQEIKDKPIDDHLKNYYDDTKKYYVDSKKASENIKASIDNTSSTVASISTALNNGVVVAKTDAELALIDKQNSHYDFQQTEIQLDNIGDTIPKTSPQMMTALKDTAVAKKNSDENTFDIDESDYTDFLTMPDISSIFGFDRKSERIVEGLNDGT